MPEKDTEIAAEPLSGAAFKDKEAADRAEAQKACDDAIAALNALADKQGFHRFGGAVRSTLAFCANRIDFERDQLNLL